MHSVNYPVNLAAVVALLAVAAVVLYGAMRNKAKPPYAQLAGLVTAVVLVLISIPPLVVLASAAVGYLATMLIVKALWRD